MSEWDFLWGLEGRELIDAMSLGGTYDDWAYIEKMERQQGFEDDGYDEFSKKIIQSHLQASIIKISDAIKMQQEDGRKHSTIKIVRGVLCMAF